MMPNIIEGLSVLKGLKSKDIADALGISTDAYRRRMRGETDFKPNELAELAQLLDMDICQFNEYLFDGKLSFMIDAVKLGEKASEYGRSSLQG